MTTPDTGRSRSRWWTVQLLVVVSDGHDDALPHNDGVSDKTSIRWPDKCFCLPGVARFVMEAGWHTPIDDRYLVPGPLLLDSGGYVARALLLLAACPRENAASAARYAG